MSTRQEGFKFFSTLVDRYEGLVKKLDTTVGEAIVLLEKANQNSDFSETRDFQKTIELFDEAVFQLRVWASNLTYQNFVSKSEKLAMRDLSTHDVLNIVDASQTPIVGSLHRTFDQIENNILTFSRHLESMTSLDKDQWYGALVSFSIHRECLFYVLILLGPPIMHHWTRQLVALSKPLWSLTSRKQLFVSISVVPPRKTWSAGCLMMAVYPGTHLS